MKQDVINTLASFIFIAGIFLIFFISVAVYSSIEEERIQEQYFLSNYGERIVLNKDTLTVVDGRYHSRLYLLDNGVSVSDIVVKSQLVK